MTPLSLRPRWLIVTTLLLFPVIACAQLQINGVSSTPSTCANNGSITVDAVTVSPPLLYSITAGPVTAEVQTSAVFNALPAGRYTVTVSDGALRSVSSDIEVTGNYLPPEFSPQIKDPFCTGGSNGRIIGNQWYGTGVAPFTWQLVAPSPITTPPQESDTFPDLPAGEYTIRLADGCGGFRTTIVTLADRPASNISFYIPPRVAMMGCDSAMLALNMHADVWRFPLTYTFVTDAGSFTTQSPTILDTSSGCCGNFTLEQLLPGFTYSNHVQVTVTDSCGNTATSPVYYAKPFRFCTQTYQYLEDCGYKTAITFDLNAFGCDGMGQISTSLKGPIIYEVTDPATNAVVRRDTVAGLPINSGYTMISGFTINDLPVNVIYNLAIRDSCGHSTTMVFHVPTVVTPAPKISFVEILPSGCMDSAAFAFVHVENFKKAPRLVLLSGPARMGSTKAGYAYESNYIYPDTIVSNAGGFGSDRFDVSNLSAGTYRFKVIDSCGSEVFGDIVVQPAQVTNLNHRFTYRKGCPGDNKLYYSIASGNGNMRIRNITTGSEILRYYQYQDLTVNIHDSLANLAAGAYELTFSYTPLYGMHTPANNAPVSCTVITDTVMIEGYSAPAVLVNNYVQCKVNTYLELIPDSSRGVAPFEYEIIAGPQTFPVQAGNLFTVAAQGTYTARIYDVCGNASTTQITISAISFPPVTELAASCNSTKLTFGRSAYYQYRWKAPNGITYTADTLTIQPVTAADTGVYTIERAADINGCRDTAISTYHLLLKNVYEQTVSICPGHSISVGAHTYSAAGIFRDTLKSMLLCDSIVVTHLTLLPLKRDTVSHIICPGQQFLFNGHSYQAAGVYSDTLPGSICDSIVTLVLSVNLKRDSVVQTICAGSSWNFNGRLLTAPGIYRDTLPTATCDSIVILNLSVLPLKRDTVHESICAGETWMFNGKSLTAAGVYTDTLPTAGCDSIVVLYLQVTTAEVHITTAPQTIVTGTSVQLEATDAKSYAWTGTGVVFNNAGIFNPVATPAASGWIMVHATSDPDGCPVTDSVFITVLDKATYCEDAYIYVPTAFTPNGDGRNDVFRIVAQKVTLKSFQIYNRWGERVFATSDIGTAWNGRHRGGLLPGSYVYMISYTDCMGVLKMLKGTVTLLL